MGPFLKFLQEEWFIWGYIEEKQKEYGNCYLGFRIQGLGLRGGSRNKGYVAPFGARKLWIRAGWVCVCKGTLFLHFKF